MKKIKLYTIFKDQNISEAPEAPTLKEQGFDVQFVNWRGFFGPPGMDKVLKKEIINIYLKY